MNEKPETNIPLSLTPTERQILDGIRRNPGRSRAEFAEEMRLSKAMLSKAVGRFVELGLVTEEREKTPSGGRGQPALRLTIVGPSIFGIGVNLTTRGLQVAVVDMCCHVLGVISGPPIESLDAATIIPVVEDCVRDALGREEIANSRCAGIAMAIRGFVDRFERLGEVTPTQRDVPYDGIRAALRERFGLPVYFEGQPQAFFEASQPNQRQQVIFHMIIDYGIGGVLAEGTRVFRGGFDQAANIGALVPEPGPRPSLTDLAAFLNEPLSELGNRRLEAMYADGDPRLDKWFETRGPVLSMPLSAVVQLFNPEAIVVGGSLPREFYERLIKHVDLSVFDVPGRMPLTKPDLRVAIAVGEIGRAESAASVPIARMLTSA